MKSKLAIAARPSPRFDAFHVLNRERLDNFTKLPSKFPGLSDAKFMILGKLYSRNLEGKSTSLAQLGTTQAAAEKLCEMRLIDLKGLNRQRAYITYFGSRTYEVLYWHKAEMLERQRAKHRSAITGKLGKM